MRRYEHLLVSAGIQGRVYRGELHKYLIRYKIFNFFREKLKGFIDFIPKSLSKKISGLEVSVRFVPFFEDIPIVCVEEASSSDFLVVFALLDEKSEIDFLKDKLVDVELLTKTRILKWVEEDSFSSKLTQDYFDQRDALVEDLSGTILSILFKIN